MFVAIRADGNSEIGMGHIMRCSSVAEILIHRGHRVCFIISKDSDSDILSDLGYEYHKLKNDSSLGWDAEETLEWLNENEVDKLIIDSYRVDEISLSRLDSALECYYIDDLYAFDYPVKNIINPNIEATIDRYKGDTKEKNYYLGICYYPIRKSILKYKKNIINKNVNSILVTTGATDPLKIEGLIAEAVPKHFSNIKFRFLIGKFFDESYKKDLENLCARNHNVFLEEWSDDVGKLYHENDIILGSGSTSLIEALTVCTPCISYSFVDNHLDECLYLDKNQMAPYCGDFRKDKDKVLSNILVKLRDFTEFSFREKYFSNYSKVFDGKGAERFADIILKI